MTFERIVALLQHHRGIRLAISMLCWLPALSVLASNPPDLVAYSPNELKIVLLSILVSLAIGWRPLRETWHDFRSPTEEVADEG